MELSEVMFKRRSVRKFTEEPVRDEDIDTLLKYAMSAPSADNKKPWEFYIVKNADLRAQLREVHRYTNYDSPVMIVVAGDVKRALPMQLAPFWIQDCSAAVENILLGATDMGLGACWCGLEPQVRAVQRTRKILGLEERIVPLALIHIGHPAAEPEPRTQYDARRVHMME